MIILAHDAKRPGIAGFKIIHRAVFTVFVIPPPGVEIRVEHRRRLHAQADRAAAGSHRTAAVRRIERGQRPGAGNSIRREALGLLESDCLLYTSAHHHLLVERLLLKYVLAVGWNDIRVNGRRASQFVISHGSFPVYLPRMRRSCGLIHVALIVTYLVHSVYAQFACPCAFTPFSCAYWRGFAHFFLPDGA